VEYAMEAISHAGACIGILTKDGVVLAAEKRVTSPLLDASHKLEKVFQLDDHIVTAVAGITADANTLIQYARLNAQQYTFQYSEPMPIEQLVTSLCDLKQGYTQYGGLRPFGVSFLYAGYDIHYGFQLYHSDPSGNYGGWKATAIGAKYQQAQSILKQEYRDDMSMKEALQLVVKVLGKTLDSTTLKAEKLEFVVLTKSLGVPKMVVMSTKQVEDLLKSCDLKSEE